MLLFRLRRSAEVKLFAFEDQVAAFNPVTWDTHLLDGPAAAVLAALERGPASADSIARLLASSRADDAEAERLTAASLDQLEAAGLIEAEPVDATR